MNFSDYKDGSDFLDKTGMNPDEAIIFLDKEIDKIKGDINEEERRKRNKGNKRR